MKKATSYVETLFTIAIFTILVFLTINSLHSYYLSLSSFLKESDCSIYFGKRIYILSPLILSDQYTIVTEGLPAIVVNSSLKVVDSVERPKSVTIIFNNGSLENLFSDSNLSINFTDKLYVSKIYVNSIVQLGNTSLEAYRYPFADFKLYYYDLLLKSLFLSGFSC